MAGLKVFIFGATSAIAQAFARLYAKEQAQFVLVGRDTVKLDAMKQDLLARGASKVEHLAADASTYADLDKQIEGAWQTLQGFDVALVAHGTLTDQDRAQKEFDYARQQFDVNFLSYAAVLTALANLFEKQGRGTIAVISSVAGDRGRQSNYVYGAAKAATTAFTDGLRNRLAPKGVHVLTVKPGFVSTPMTAHLPQGPLFVGPDKVGKDIQAAISKQKDILYTPWFWCWIMLIIKLIPERIFKKLKL